MDWSSSGLRHSLCPENHIKNRYHSTNVNAIISKKKRKMNQKKKFTIENDTELNYTDTLYSSTFVVFSFCC